MLSRELVAAPKDQWSLASSTWAVALAIGGGARQGIAQAELPGEAAVPLPAAAFLANLG
jgi:hypothetical protein